MLLWLDLETTGLDPVHNRILEVAWHATAQDLHDHDKMTYHNLVTPSLETWDQLEEFNSKLSMHLDSGLYDDLKQEVEPTLELSDIEESILAYMELRYDDIAEKPVWYLAGASVHFDLNFIRNWMPRLADKLSHRVYDTSTLTAFFYGFLDFRSIENKGQHRAHNDVDYCIEIARGARESVAVAKAAMSVIEDAGAGEATMLAAHLKGYI